MAIKGNDQPVNVSQERLKSILYDLLYKGGNKFYSWGVFFTIDGERMTVCITCPADAHLPLNSTVTIGG